MPTATTPTTGNSALINALQSIEITEILTGEPANLDEGLFILVESHDDVLSTRVFSVDQWHDREHGHLNSQ
jgi:hypothetical protein